MGRWVRPAPSRQDAGTKTVAHKLTRWPVTISYFDRNPRKADRGGEQTPVYAISFEEKKLYENGISRLAALGIQRFSDGNELTSLEIKKKTIKCPNSLALTAPAEWNLLSAPGP